MRDTGPTRASGGAVYRVGKFEVHPDLNRIDQGECRVRCEPRVIDLLVCLIHHAPAPVSTRQLRAEVWPATSVSPDAIWRCVSELRRIFGDAARDPRYIETIPRRGYRLIAPVEFVADPPPTRGRRWPRIVAAAAATVLLSIAAGLIFRTSNGRDDPATVSARAFSSFEAFTAFSKGKLLGRRGMPDDVVLAVQHLEAATDLDPNSALAHSELAQAWIRAGRLRLMPEHEPFDQAKRAAMRAVKLDATLGSAHAALGSVLFWHERRWDAAAQELGIALDIEPEDVRARRDWALLLGALGRHGEAEVEIDRAWRLELSAHAALESGWLYYFGGRPEDAVDECLFAEELLPGSAEIRSCLIAAHLQAGRRRLALDVIRSRDHLGSLSALDTARLLMNEGRPDPALQWIERASDERYAELAHLRVDPLFRPLHSDPRFLELLRRLGFQG